ncbi:hypothetical protein GCM10027280_53050 [Micromonospora polyrhachis]|uniref:Uncharacterized protein n=1 Tax=Micromonospora polyrhachis TaxID=1282883 RepID=A0A7W7SYB7_9ACTN|nr:hypothetical protein [Micromonospora polyrhachis]MBB4961875.1 hypothetical protein [Micromonospora polyrhachis]
MPDTRTLALSFEVAGLPPVQTEALSILAPGHRQAARVQSLRRLSLWEEAAETP